MYRTLEMFDRCACSVPLAIEGKRQKSFASILVSDAVFHRDIVVGVLHSIQNSDAAEESIFCVASAASRVC